MKFTIIEIGKVIRALSSASEKIKTPFKRVFLLDEQREKECIKNMEAYLEAVAPVIVALKKIGASEAELHAWLQKLHVPVIEATLELLVARRKNMIEPKKEKETSSNAPEPTP